MIIWSLTLFLTVSYFTAPSLQRVCVLDECKLVFFVSGPNGIPDTQITSSPHDVAPYFARLNGGKAWGPRGNGKGAWIQVQFHKTETLQAVVTQGSPRSWYFVRTYKVAISTDCIKFDFITNASGADKVFIGNTRPFTATVTAYLGSNVRAKCLRLYPLTPYGSINVRLDVLGCV